MTAVDELIEKGAERLEQASDRVGSGNGFKGRLREELADDAQFLRKLKPSAIAARAHGEKPPEDTMVATPPPRPQRRSSGGGPNPLLVVACAFVAGYVLAKLVDWRGHAHPRV
jgi:hypothetical protein